MNKLLLTATSSLCFAGVAMADEKPNIIIILADDLGYSDIGCFGGELETPNLDRLANEGLRFSRFMNCGMSVCSRSSLLTGMWSPPAALTKAAKQDIIPQQLKEVGYKTAHFGKWHQNGNPMDRGFDHFFGFLGGGSDHVFGSADYRLDNEVFSDFGEDYYSTDAFTDRAIKFVEKSSKESDDPFFMYLCYQAPHNPIQAPADEIEEHRGYYAKKGWQQIREERFERQKQMGIFDKDLELPAYPENFPQWDSLNEKQKDLEDMRMSVYAAMVEHMDAGIGQLLESLEKCGELDNTFILFMSDNGTDGFKVLDVPLLKKGLLPSDPHANYQPGPGAAYASGTPWRLYKISQHGGGITTGAIAWSPKYVKKHRQGEVYDQMIHFVDIMPTLAEIAGAEVSDNIPGESFLPIFKNRKWVRKGNLYFQFMDNRAIRTDKWTLVEVDDFGWELYDNQKDPFETTDLINIYPDVAENLIAEWNKWWTEVSGKEKYVPTSVKGNGAYIYQGDRGSGDKFTPSEMIKR